MTQRTKKGSQLSPVGHEMIGDTLGTPILQCGLLQEIESLHKEDAWLQSTGPSSKTLVKHPDLRVVLIAMRKNMRMSEHKAIATISVQTLAGHIRLTLLDRTSDLPTGQLLVLDQGVRHDVEAVEDSAFLLTMSWHGQKSETDETASQK
jgi:quercetin dioxygenase-like cupin family protein